MRSHPGDKYVAVDIEACVWPGENAFGPFRAQQLLADKHRQNLAGKDLGETRVVDPRDLMEDARLVGPALGHQKMEVQIDPVPEGPDGGDDPGPEGRIGVRKLSRGVWHWLMETIFRVTFQLPSRLPKPPKPRPPPAQRRGRLPQPDDVLRIPRGRALSGRRPLRGRDQRDGDRRPGSSRAEEQKVADVSYTHLTLPTILRV